MSHSKKEKQPHPIFNRLLDGESIPMNDPDYVHIGPACDANFELLKALNDCTNAADAREKLATLLGTSVDETTTIFPPFHTNYGRNIQLGKGVFINQACCFLALGGITIEDDVMIGPRVTITSENHPSEIKSRKTMVPASVIIKRNAWIGASATISSGVTIGENSVVAAGAVVLKDVPANTVVGGVPAKELKKL